MTLSMVKFVSTLMYELWCLFNILFENMCKEVNHSIFHYTFVQYININKIIKSNQKVFISDTGP